jgi:hypothetical protein
VTPAQSISRDEADDEVRAMVAELTRSHRHRETYTRQVGATLWTGQHVTEVPSLLVQLRYASASGQGGSRSGSGFESRPAASLESLATLTMIDLEVSRWVRDLGEDDPTSTVACVQLLGGLLPSATRCKLTHGRTGCCTWHEVERDVRRWYTQARIITGWDAPAWRPDNTCPNCAVRRSLRIRLAERVGFCTECRETWSPADYQVLAEHIRNESQADRVPLDPGPCWCPWPVDDVVVGLAKLCPRCGSARCRHAVRKAGERPGVGGSGAMVDKVWGVSGVDA